MPFDTSKQGFGEAVAELYQDAVTRYEQYLPLALPWLLSNYGITEPTAVAARLGVAHDPLARHKNWADRLIIPYMRKGAPYQLKSRCMKTHPEGGCKQAGHPKYLAEGDMEPSLFNVDALLEDQDLLAITEGELNTIVLTREMRLTGVGYPGVGNWRPHFTRAIGPDWPSIVVIADGDEAGRKSAAKIAAEIVGARVVEMPPGADVASVYADRGELGLCALLGIEIS